MDRGVHKPLVGEIVHTDLDVAVAIEHKLDVVPRRLLLLLAEVVGVVVDRVEV